jgi:hypothetical protein
VSVYEDIRLEGHIIAPFVATVRAEAVDDS